MLRIVVGYLYLQHGTAKLLGFPHVAMFDNLQLFSLIGLAGALELVGGILLILGLFVRPVAFILSRRDGRRRPSWLTPSGCTPSWRTLDQLLSGGSFIASSFCSWPWPAAGSGASIR